MQNRAWKKTETFVAVIFLYNIPIHNVMAATRKFSLAFPLGRKVINHFKQELRTYSMQQSPSGEANRFSANQKIPCISCNPKVHFRFYNWPPPVPILSQINSVHAPYPTSWILLGFDQYVVICVFSFTTAISNAKALGSGTSGSAVRVSVCLTLLTSRTFNS